jgi:hypothetical protein
MGMLRSQPPIPSLRFAEDWSSVRGQLWSGLRAGNWSSGVVWMDVFFGFGGLLWIGHVMEA